MAQTKHTLGEWKARHESPLTFRITNDAKIMRLADVYADIRNNASNSITIKEAKANATLMAAAPRMVSDLQDEVDFLQALIDDEVNKLPVTVRSTIRFRIIELKKTIIQATF